MLNGKPKFLHGFLKNINNCVNSVSDLTNKTNIMPSYSYICSECSHTFDKFLSISKRNEPENAPCPSCGKTNCVHISIGLSSIVSGVNLKDKRPEGFKDVLRKIKKSHPSGNIDV